MATTPSSRVSCSTGSTRGSGRRCATDTISTIARSINLTVHVVLQADGGFLGSDVLSFVSAVVSGAPGAFIVLLLADAGTETALIVRPGQHVVLTGDASLPQPPRWGSGSFTVHQSGTLTLQSISVGGSLSVTGGGVAILMACSGQLTSLSVTDSSFSIDATSTTIIGGSISLSNAGLVTLEAKTFADGAQVTIGEGTSLSFARMAVRGDLLHMILLSAPAGSSMRLSEVTVMDTRGALETVNGSASVGENGLVTYDPPGFLPAVCTAALR